MTRIITTVCLLLGCALVTAQIDDTDKLLVELDNIGSMQGQFQQRQYDQNNSLVAQSSGRFRLLRPGYFAWEIESPDSQLIIADPQYIWHHDRDLETVTRRPVVDSEQMSPLQVLGGNEAVLRNSFTVEQSAQDTFILHPTGINPGFQRLLVTFNESGFMGLEIADNLKQRVVISFENVDSGTTLTPEDFSFAAPEGADLFYYDE